MALDWTDVNDTGELTRDSKSVMFACVAGDSFNASLVQLTELN